MEAALGGAGSCGGSLDAVKKEEQHPAEAAWYGQDDPYHPEGHADGAKYEDGAEYEDQEDEELDPEEEQEDDAEDAEEEQEEGDAEDYEGANEWEWDWIEHSAEVHEIMKEKMANDPKGNHPWSPRPGHHSAGINPRTGERAGKRRDLSDEELTWLRMEEGFAREAGLKPHERGPAPSGKMGGFWRGQAWREGVQGGRSGFSNRAGSPREYYRRMAQLGLLKPTPGKNHPDRAAWEARQINRKKPTEKHPVALAAVRVDEAYWKGKAAGKEKGKGKNKARSSSSSSSYLAWQTVTPAQGTASQPCKGAPWR